ncbi:UDP-glucosyltransferase 2-like [Anabrus simplex]|uniref:UDP-glucosyltransferase 2-like n=1 Tax=Anabrus simplex TaxID=316456 RepID=UPI0035A2A8E4
MKPSLVLVTVLLCCLSSASGANILALFNLATRSHHIWTSTILLTLAERGHNVTVLSTMAQKQPAPNLTEIVITGIYEFIAGTENFALEEMSEISSFSMTKIFGNWIKLLCSYSIQNEATKTLLNYPDNFKFDLIIYEPLGAECLLGLAKRFGSPPLIAISGLNHPQWVNDIVGNPDNPAYITNIFLPYTDRMTFLQKTNNFLLNMYMQYLWKMDIIPAYDDLSSQYLGPSASIPSEEISKTSIVMVNTHPSFDYARPLLPSIVNIAGIHIKDPQPLPKDLKNFLDEAKEGVIYFSLGTNLRSDKLRKDKREALLSAFAELPQKVLWKWESDSLPGQPKNVIVRKWLSQRDILAHPNVRLFITHSGLLSTHEAIYRGVPMVGIPFFMDQQTNIQKVIDHGVGLRLDYEDITKETVLKAIRTVLDDPSYAKNMRDLSARFRDQPESPMERAVYWCEYVLRHKGAHHLRSAAVDLTWYQYLLLDVIALLTAAILLPVVLLWCCCRRIFTKKQTQKKIKRN